MGTVAAATIVVARARKASTSVERVVAINRVAKVVKGGRRFSFTALVVVGDGDGTVGVGYGKAKEVPAAIAKVEEAAEAFLRRPADPRHHPAPGAGREGGRRGAAASGFAWYGCLIAGGSARAVLKRRRARCAREVAGIGHAINVVHATVEALQSLEQPESVARRRQEC